MLCFVNIEHDRALEDPDTRKWSFANCTEIQLKLEEISGEACLVQRYQRVTRQRLEEWGIKVLFISGNVTDWEEYDAAELAEMQAIIREAKLPIMGFCGGHQLIGMAHGAPGGPIRRLRAGEEIPAKFAPGFFKEWEFMPVRVVREDPLFEGLNREPVFFEAHYWELKEVPPGFENLAMTDECPIQVIKRQDKLVYGTQFHPELYDDDHSDGRRVISNFLSLSGIIS
jgi:GMP synthase (glutamine-hydrolysing)